MNTNSPTPRESWLNRIFASQPRSTEEVEANADHESPGALHELGVLYSSDRAKADLEAAARCFRQAAERGHALAQTSLGLLYLKGDGVARDDKEAGKWFMQAAAQGDACAQYHLATQYHRRSFEQSNGEAEEARIEALKWFSLAAAQNYQNAESCCGLLILRMNVAQLAESNRRVTAFKSAHGLAEPGIKLPASTR